MTVTTLAGVAGLAAALFLPVTALAVDIGTIPDTGGGETNLATAVTNIIKGILMLLGIIAVIVIVIAGLRLLVGGADEQQRTKARDQILWAIVGLVIIVLASAIVTFVEDSILNAT